MLKVRACRGVDFGSVYASKTFQLRDGRRVLLGWVYETAAGCEAECSTGTNFTYSLVSDSGLQYLLGGLMLRSPRARLRLRSHPIMTCDLCVLCQGWQGAHTLPREVRLDAESASLLMNPVEEVTGLRQKVLYRNSTLQLPYNSSSGGLQVDAFQTAMPGARDAHNA